MSEARVEPDLHQHRYRDRRGLVLAAAALGAVLFLLLGEALVGGKLLTQADALYQFAPWKDVAPEDYEPQNPLLLDQSTVMQPWLHFAAERLHEGTLPWWNPNNYAGQPMVGTYQTAYFWPLNWIYLAFPSWHFYAWSAFLRLLLTGLFTYLFLRRIGVGFEGGLVGGLGFALSGFMIAWLGHMHTHAAMFLPALFWQVERIAGRPTWRNAGWLGLLAAGCVLAGHIQTTVHMALAAAAYVGFRLAVPVGGVKLARRGLTRLLVGITLGGFVAMPQVLPFLDYLGSSQGAVVLEHVQQTGEVDSLAAAALMIDPGRDGSPAPGQGYGPYTGQSGSNVNYNELIGGYVGRALLVLALLQLVWLRRGRATWFFAGLGLIAALIAWRVSPIYDIAWAVPKLKSTKLLRFSLLLAFALSVLGAMGLDGLVRRFSGARRGLLLGAGTFALVALELLSFARGYNPMVEPELVTPPTPVTDYLQAQPGLWRVLGLDNSALIPSANLFYDLPLVGGYDSMEPRTYTELVARMSSDERGQYFIKEIRYFDQGGRIGDLLGVKYLLADIELPPPFRLVHDGPTRVYENPSAMPRAFAGREVRVIEDSTARLDFMGADTYDPYVVVLEEPHEALPEGNTLGTGEVAISSYEDLRIELDCDFESPGVVVLADVWDKSWRAELDGEAVPILRVDHTLRGVVVGPGQHELVFRYRPTALHLGLGLALIGLLGLIAMATRPG